jgi:ketosteroid isomerase-like protein
MANNRSEIEHQAAIERTRLAVSRYASAWLAGDRAALAACYHDDFTLHYFGRNPLAGDHRGKAAALGILAEVTRRTNRKLLAIVDVMAGPERGALLVRERFERDGRTAEVERLLVYAVRDGLLSECWVYDQDHRRLPDVKLVQTASPIGLAFRAGIVIAATPTTTQASPIQAVELNCSPRKTTPNATPIGTRK